MASLSSSSTLEEIEAAYVDNASYAEDRSVTKCLAFTTAARVLLLKLPVSAAKGGSSSSFSVESIKSELDKAEAWLGAQSTNDTDRRGPNVTRADFRGFR